MTERRDISENGADFSCPAERRYDVLTPEEMLARAVQQIQAHSAESEKIQRRK